jgi:uncharacterized protein (UPF0371 family)
MGYFRVTTRFFNPNLFYEHDINLVVEKFKFDPNDISMIDYAHSRTSYRHQEEILREFSIAAFNTEYQALLYQEAKRLT